MNEELLYFKKFLLIDIKDAILFYIFDFEILTNEELKIFKEFYWKDNIELVLNKFINHYYKNAFGYDNTSFDEQLNKVFYYYSGKLKHFRETDFILDEVLIDIISKLFDEKQTNLK
jgi:hypothetical protein